MTRDCSWHVLLASSSTNCLGRPLPRSNGAHQLEQHATVSHLHLSAQHPSALWWHLHLHPSLSRWKYCICFAATLPFHDCLDIYIPPRDITLCQDFILVALSTLIKAVTTWLKQVGKKWSCLNFWFYCSCNEGGRWCHGLGHHVPAACLKPCIMPWHAAKCSFMCSEQTHVLSSGWHQGCVQKLQHWKRNYSWAHMHLFHRSATVNQNNHAFWKAREDQA